MNFFEKNLAVLRRRDPLLAKGVEKVAARGRVVVEIAANGEPTVKIRGLALHSFRDPGKEGRNWAQHAAAEYDLPASGEVTVLGFGLGYHLKGLAELKIGGTVIEPDLELFAAALEYLDLTDVLENFRLLVGKSLEKLRRAHGDNLAGIMLPHPPALRLHPDTVGTLQEYGEGIKAARSGG